MEMENTELQTNSQIEEITYPYITFKIQSSNYCISSRLVSSMTMISDIVAIPDSPPYVLGLMTHKSAIIPMIDVRILLGMPSLEDMYTEFMERIEMRKIDHINWVNEFERCVNAHEEFKLATDPHKCAFGKWFYEFYNKGNVAPSVNAVLNRIEEPHSKLHSYAITYQENPYGEKVCAEVLNAAELLCYNVILPLLDELRQVFSTQYKSMAIILECDNKLQGITVDEVNSIKYFKYDTQSEKITNSPNDNYIKSVIKDEDGTLYLEIDSDKITLLNRKSLEEVIA